MEEHAAGGEEEGARWEVGWALEERGGGKGRRKGRDVEDWALVVLVLGALDSCLSSDGDRAGWKGVEGGQDPGEEDDAPGSPPLLQNELVFQAFFHMCVYV